MRWKFRPAQLTPHCTSLHLRSARYADNWTSCRRQGRGCLGARQGCFNGAEISPKAPRGNFDALFAPLTDLKHTSFDGNKLKMYRKEHDKQQETGNSRVGKLLTGRCLLASPPNLAAHSSKGYTYPTLRRGLISGIGPLCAWTLMGNPGF